MGNRESICDLTIVCPDGSFRVNKQMCIERSSYLSAMFRSGMQEAGSSKIQTRTRYEVAHAIFSYIQYGELPTYGCEQTFIDIYAEADVYELRSLRELMLHNLYYDCFDGMLSYYSLCELTDDEDILRMARSGLKSRDRYDKDYDIWMSNQVEVSMPDWL